MALVGCGQGGRECTVLSMIVGGFASVLVDGAERLGELSYVVPEGLAVRVGDAVEVPFGANVRRGLVTGPDSGERATREITLVYGRRSSEVDIAVARDIAVANLCEFTSVAKRLAPSTKRGNAGVEAGEVVLREGARFAEFGRGPRLSELPRRIEMVGPSADVVRLAALEAAELAQKGQVLILCPSKEVVRQVQAEFTSGSARLDVVPKKDELSAWNGFVAGTVRIGVATRAGALWAGADLAGIVVVDEDHPGHREVTTPYTSARDVAAKRTKANGAALVLLSHNPSPSGLGADVKIVVVGKEWPTTTVVTRKVRQRWTPEMPGGLSAIIAKHEAKESEILVVAGTSRSSRRCSVCRLTWRCEVCESGSCEHCEPNCVKCGAEDVLIIGWDAVKSARVTGVERVIVPSAMSGADKADLVVLLDVDPWLGMAELVPGRVASNRILEAARLVRPGGELVMVTCSPEDELLALLAKGDLIGLARRTWSQAREEALPPFGRQVTISGEGRAPKGAQWPGRVLGPKPNGTGWEIMILAKNSEMPALQSVLARVRRRAKVRVTVL